MFECPECRAKDDWNYCPYCGKQINKVEKTSYDKIIEMFNTICVSLPKVELLTDIRKKHIKTRASELKKWGDWEKFFQRIENSDFLSGRGADWKATFDWIIKQANFVKIMEGNYDNKQVVIPQKKIVVLPKSICNKCGNKLDFGAICSCEKSSQPNLTHIGSASLIQSILGGKIAGER